jgi:ArsR family transcriptional regulator
MLMLINYYGELCVCELMHALNEPMQPKVSRNLAVLRKAQLLQDHKRGQWVFYQLNTALPQWCKTVIAETTEGNANRLVDFISRLDTMKGRPDKSNCC